MKTKLYILPLLVALLIAFTEGGMAQTTNNEGFESGLSTPAGWTNSNTTDIFNVTGAGSNPADSPHGGTHQMEFNSYSLTGGTTAYLITPVFDLTCRGGSTPTFSIWFYRDATAYTGDATEGVTIKVNTAAADAGTTLGFIPRDGTQSATGYASSTGGAAPGTGWYQYTYNIPAGFNTATNYIILHFSSQFGDNCYIDDAQWISYPGPCVAPISTFPWCESFDGGTFAPTNWANTNISGTILWQRSTAGTSPVCAPHSGAGMAYFNSFSFTIPNEALLVTPALNTTGSYVVTFWMYGDNGYSAAADLVNVYSNTVPNKTGAPTLLGTIQRYNATNGWYSYTYALASSASLYVIFDGVSAYGDNIFIDDICVHSPCALNTITLTSAAGTDAQTKCISTAITNITYATTGATGATFAGLPAGVTGSWAGNVVTISGTPTASGVFAYTITLTGGCGTVTITGTITVQATTPPVAAIVGTTPLCAGNNEIFTDASGGGTWSSSAPGVATIVAGTGFATGVAIGATTISYAVTNACGTTTQTYALTVIAACGGVTILESGPNYTIASCPFTGTFYDSGGSGGNYNNNENFTETITAPAGKCLSVAFTSFSTEYNYDYLYIYDGPSTASSLIGTYNNTNSPGTVLSSSGSLTFHFTSDGSVVSSGWAANVTCAACTPDACVNATALTSGVLLGGQTNAAATFSSSDPTPSCYWDGFGNTTWYTLTTVATSSITALVTNGTMTYPAVSIYTGACGTLAQVGCTDANTFNYNPSLTTGCLPAGTYHIMVWDDAGTGGTFGITATAVGCAINNNPCGSAFAIPPANLNGGWNTGFTSVGATADGSQAPAPFNYDCYTANDWFSFVAQGPNIEISVSSGIACMRPEINLYSSNPCAGGLEPIGLATYQGCVGPTNYSSISLFNNDPSMAAPSYFPLTIGQTYWFAVTFNTAAGCTGTYSVHVNNPVNPDPPGTDCKTAQILCAGGTYSGAANLWGAQELSYVYPNTNNKTCCNLAEEINSSWYVLNILTGGTLTFTLQAIDGTDDYDYAMYKGATCTLGNPVSCNYSSYPGITGIDGANCTACVVGGGITTCANDGAPGQTVATASPANSCDGCTNFTNAQIGNAASTWNSTLNVLTGEVYIFYVNGYTPSSGSYQFTFGGSAVLGCTLPVVLPISLVSFTATPNGNEVDLNWSTATETNNKNFTIERSADGQDFTELLQKKGAGTSTERQNYTAVDYEPLPGTSYYRLSQTDFNGTTNQLTIVSVNNTNDDGKFKVTPNPTDGVISITYSCGAATTGILNIYDDNGALQLSKEITCIAGNNKTQLDLGGKASGIYLITFTTNDKFYRTKLMKK